jgi:3-hydroxyacyl-CoA dehydrogenase
MTDHGGNVGRRTVAVLGAGLIGQSWSALFAAYGHDVIAWDPADDWTPGFHAFVDRALRQIRALESGDILEGTIRCTPTLEEAVASASWVQENAPESVPLKHELYARVEAAIGPETIIASSTSSLTWSVLSGPLALKERFVTAHPFNPPHLMPLVEIFAPDARTRDAAHRFFTGLERRPVFLEKEAVGHIANRLASALWREAVHIVDQGIASVADVDAALVHGPGLRWSVQGAHMAYHLGGGPGGLDAYLRHLGPSQVRRWATLGTPDLTEALCRRLVQGIEDEAAGRSVSDLESERDAALMRILRAHRGAGQ